MWYLVKNIKHSNPRWLGMQAAIRYLALPTAIDMAYRVYPDKNADSEAAPLIIMHGMLGSKKNWKDICYTMSANLVPKRKVYAVDARNHGDSPHSPDHSYEHMASDVAHFLKKENLLRSVVMGHSMGGAVMMYFALTYPHLVDKAIIVDVSPVRAFTAFASMDILYNAMKDVQIPGHVSSITEAREIAYRHLVQTIQSRKTINFILLNLKKGKDGKFFWTLNIDSLQKNNAVTSIFPKDVLRTHHFEKPVLFIGGIKSIFIYTNDIPIIKKTFPAAKFEWMNCGHLVHVEKPLEFQNIVIDFLSR